MIRRRGTRASRATLLSFRERNSHFPSFPISTYRQTHDRDSGGQKNRTVPPSLAIASAAHSFSRLRAQTERTDRQAHTRVAGAHTEALNFSPDGRVERNPRHTGAWRAKLFLGRVGDRALAGRHAAAVQCFLKGRQSPAGRSILPSTPARGIAADAGVPALRVFVSPGELPAREAKTHPDGNAAA